jgi:hypothetical protein
MRLGVFTFFVSRRALRAALIPAVGPRSELPAAPVEPPPHLRQPARLSFARRSALWGCRWAPSRKSARPYSRAGNCG